MSVEDSMTYFQRTNPQLYSNKFNKNKNINKKNVFM